MNPEWKARYERLVSVAQEAGRHALGYFPDTRACDFAEHVIWKGDNSPVTRADREAETIFRDKLLGEFTGDGFLGEEHGEVPSSSGYRWIVDPIDGTRSFVRGIPHWGTLAGLEYRGERIAGVVYEPVIGRTWRAVRGEGCFRDDERICVSTVDRLDRSHMFFSSLDWFLKGAKKAEFADLVGQTERQRGFGDYYGHLLVAQGSGEFMIEYGVHEWDVAALEVIIEEAGGRFTDWSGAVTTKSAHCLASNGKLHDDVLRIIRGSP
jgi:histidinol-phosphatase